MASASIDADPERNHAMNFATAMPMFARNAAMMALPPPEALMRRVYGRRTPRPEPLASRRAPCQASRRAAWPAPLASVGRAQDDGLGRRGRVARVPDVSDHLEQRVAEQR